MVGSADLKVPNVKVPAAVRGLLWPTDLHLTEGQLAALVGGRKQASLDGANCDQD